MNIVDKIMSFAPQTADIDFGTEPSLDRILEEYYIEGGFTAKEVEKFVKEYKDALCKHLENCK